MYFGKKKTTQAEKHSLHQLKGKETLPPSIKGKQRRHSLHQLKGKETRWPEVP